MDDPGRVDRAVAVQVIEVQVAPGTDGDARRLDLCLGGGPLVAAGPGDPGAGDGRDDPGRVDPPDPARLVVGDVHVPRGVDGHTSRRDERGSGRGRGERGDDAVGADAPDGLMVDVREVEGAVGIEGDGPERGPIIADVAGPPSPESPATPVPAMVTIVPLGSGVSDGQVGGIGERPDSAAVADSAEGAGLPAISA